MAIDTTYRKILIENFIKQKLHAGSIPSASELEEQIETLLEETDLTVPQFVGLEFHVAPKEESSATKLSNTFGGIYQDLRVLYKELMRLTTVSVDSYERWELESQALEKRLIDIEEDITNLLLLTQDTEGYHSYLVDNFTDYTLIDTAHTNAHLDLLGKQMVMGPSRATHSRIFLNDLKESDVSFRVRSTVNFVGRTDMAGSDLRNPFSQVSASWWTEISMSTASPVTSELVVKLGENSQKISRIFIELHDSTRSAPVSITPLVSVDNYTYSQLPSVMFSQEVRNVATFNFPEVEAKFIKLVLTKAGPDPGANPGAFNYQFGFKQISFYRESFDTTKAQILVSKPLWVRDATNQPVEFSKITLDACDRIELDTNIDYFVTASNDEAMPLDANTEWFPITPINRGEAASQRVLDLGDTLEQVIGDAETVTVSYDGRSTNPSFTNPAKQFHLLSKSVSGNVQDEIINAAAIRYAFLNPNDRILNYQIKDSDFTGSGTGTAIEVDESSIKLYRNVGVRGLDASDNTSKVRGIQKGWRFEDPYYITTIEILNPEGMSIDVGDKPIIVDDKSLTNLVTLTSGLHLVKVHKDSWLEVEPGLTSLETLSAADILYPFNHKLLIEGYDYPDTYPLNEEKIYIGVDLFAELLAKKVSIFDMVNNIEPKDYRYFAVDRDAPDTHTLHNESTRVFVVKVDHENSDYSNERFVLKFKLVNQKFKYLRLRADFTTENTSISPSLDAYKIKIG